VVPTPQTHGTNLAGKGFTSSARMFAATGRRMLRDGGAKALYVGVVPRLLQQVPSSMLCWYTIHTVERLLQQSVVIQDEHSSGGGGGDAGRGGGLSGHSPGGGGGGSGVKASDVTAVAAASAVMR